MTSDHENDDICAYCGEPKLTGTENPEHVLPAAINGRFTTRSVCGDCNEWAGEKVDQPWLEDPFVGHTRFVHEIPNRYGKLIEFDPLLTGETEDGTRIAIDRDGRPHALNSPIVYDEEADQYTIKAKDHEDAERLRGRFERRAEDEGKTAELGPMEERSEHPQVEGAAVIHPGHWARMAAKVTLGYLAETRPPEWRTSPTAEMLRNRMRDFDSGPEFPLLSADDFARFAPSPATALVLTSVADGVSALVSLMGIFVVRMSLGDDMEGIDRAWVSDPVDPARSVEGTLREVVGLRNK